MTEWNGKVTVDSKEYKVTWDHDRFDDPKDMEVLQACVRARTMCYIWDADRGEDDPFGFDCAECSWSDNFSRRVGRKLSLQRALLNSDFTEDQRRQVWAHVLSIKGLVQ